MIAEALARLRHRWRRSLLAAAGVFAAATMLGTAVAVGFALHGGFDRTAQRADLPDVIARFDTRSLPGLRERLAALPDVAALAFREEVLGIPLSAGSHSTGKGTVEVVRPGRRGYAVVAGRDIGNAPGEVVVERGVARALGVGVGDRLRVGELGPERVVGLAVAPDDVAFPLAKTARVYISLGGLERRLGRTLPAQANVAELWAVDPSRLDITLAQARATTAGVRGLRFTTRAGVRVLIDEAAGIVIALLVALSLVALGVVGVVLAASARAEVQRTLPVLGVRRALGFSRGRASAVSALEAGLLAAPAAALGLAAGAALAHAPAARLLEALNELGPGAAVLLPLAAAWIAVVALVTVAAGWPAWRAAGRSPVALLRGGDLSHTRSVGPSARGFLDLGARLALARPGRLAALTAVLGAATAFVLLLLGLASLLRGLENDPGTVGKRYALTADLPPSDLPDVRAIPGVAAAAERLSVPAADSFDLGESLELVAYRDHTRFEDPPLAAGRRGRGPGEAEVGTGLASALGLSPGSTLAVQLAGGGEARFRVVGLVRALAHDGRVAYVRPERLRAAGYRGEGSLAVALGPGADRSRVTAALNALGGSRSSPPARPAAAATPRAAPFLGTIAALLTAVAVIDGLVCLFVLVQALGLAARERGQTLALLRTLGAGPRALGLVFAGAGGALVVPALVAGLVLERFVLAPAVARLAAGYAELPLAPPAGQVVLVGVGVLLLATLAGAWTTYRTGRDSIVEGLRAG